MYENCESVMHVNVSLLCFLFVYLHGGRWYREYVSMCLYVYMFDFHPCIDTFFCLQVVYIRLSMCIRIVHVFACIDMFICHGFCINKFACGV